MSKRNQEGTSNEGSPMAKSQSANLGSHRNLSIARQNSPKDIIGSSIPGSGRMDHVSAGYGEPLRSSTSERLFLRSQEWSMGNTSNVGSEHPEQGAKPASNGKPLRGAETQQNDSNREFRNMKITDNEYMTKVLPNLQKKLGVIQDLPKFAMEAYTNNLLMWRFFVSSSTKAGIHLDPIYTDNLEVHKNANFEDFQSLFDITKKLILVNQEILNVNSIGSEVLSWTRSTLLDDQAIKWTKATVLLYSDSVLRLGRIDASEEANRKWKGQVTESWMINCLGGLLRPDGEPIEFEWNIFPGFTALHLHVHVQRHRLQQRRKWRFL